MCVICKRILTIEQEKRDTCPLCAPAGKAHAETLKERLELVNGDDE
jgi:hypothetical protein